MSQKGNDYSKLYIVEKLLRIVEEQGQRFVIVKWKNFIQATKEPVQNFRDLPSCIEELQKLEDDFQNKKHSLSMDIKVKEYYRAYINKQNSLQEDNSQINQKSVDQSKDISLELKIRCKQIARDLFKKKINAGLKDVTAKDYFYFLELYYKCYETLQVLQLQNNVPITDKALQKVKGVIRQGDGFRYCVVVDSKCYTCSLEEMKQHFPLHLAKFLQDFTLYMKNYMAEQIKDYEDLIKNRCYRQKAFKKMHEALQSSNLLQARRKGDKLDVFFGVDEADCLQNRKKQLQRKQYFTTILAQYCKQKGQIQQNNNQNTPLSSMYEELMNIVNSIKKKKSDKKRQAQMEAEGYDHEEDSKNSQYIASSKSDRKSARLREKVDKSNSLKKIRNDQGISSSEKRKRIKKY